MRLTTDLKGVIPPLVTPVTDGNEPDYDGLRNLVRYVVDAGVNGVFTLGGTGNFASFNTQERVKVGHTVVSEIKGRVPVIMGCIDTNTRVVLQLVALAGQIGVDAVIVEPPLYYPCTDEDVETHFTVIAAASPVPVIIYNCPSANKVRMTLPLIRKLADQPNIAGIKESSGDFDLFQQLVDGIPSSQFVVTQGLEQYAGASFLMGATSSILMLANVVPKLCLKLFEAGSTGDVMETRRLQSTLMAAFEIFKDYRADANSNPYYGQLTVSAVIAGLEGALDALGICRHVSMAPWQIPSQAEKDRVRHKLAEMESRW